MLNPGEGLENKPRQPEVIAERCVHSRIPSASCRACVDICPGGAWQLDEQQLGIDTSLCDGCGICAGACPEQAIEHLHRPLTLRWRDRKVAMLACEKSVKQPPGIDDGIVHCVHAFGIRELQQLHARGYRRLFVSTACCTECSRGRPPLLDLYLERLNNLFRARGEDEIERVDISPMQWENMLASTRPEHRGDQLSRRSLLRHTLHRIGRLGLGKFDRHEIPPVSEMPLSSLYGENPDAAVFLNVPEIDTSLCSACNACVRLCPHEALTLDREDMAYRIDPRACTACGICVDVCEDRAIRILDVARVEQYAIALDESRCDACGSPFYSLNDVPEALCPVCRHKNHAARLYQVID